MTKTGRKIVLDPDWTILPIATQGFHSFLYKSDIEFILIRTNCEVRFQRIVPVNADAGLADVEWDQRTGEQYYIFKVDPAQEIVIVGTSSVRFFRSEVEKPGKVSRKVGNRTPLGMETIESCRRPWEAEDVYQERDVIGDEIFPPEHLAEVARRFKAWRATSTQSLFVYLVVPKRLSGREKLQLIENDVQVVEDVPWVL